MNTPFAIALLVVGIILLIFGFTSMDSINSSFTKFFSGHPTDKSMWLLIGGAVALVIGLVGFTRGRNA